MHICYKNKKREVKILNNIFFVLEVKRSVKIEYINFLFPQPFSILRQDGWCKVQSLQEFYLMKGILFLCLGHAIVSNVWHLSVHLCTLCCIIDCLVSG